MKKAIDISNKLIRSKERISKLGEVFTPHKYANELIEMLANEKHIWDLENTIYFEPCCGHGNIVIALYNKRLEAFYKKAIDLKIKNPELYSIANAINNLWAIDIDNLNIQECRSRVLNSSLELIKINNPDISISQYIFNNQDFFIHLLCAIKWQIHENEALSSISPPSLALEEASKTKIGLQWIQSKGHRPLDFNLPWVAYFKECQLNQIIPIEYKRSLKFLKKITTGAIQKSEEYCFAHILISEIYNSANENQKRYNFEILNNELHSGHIND